VAGLVGENHGVFFLTPEGVLKVRLPKEGIKPRVLYAKNVLKDLAARVNQ